MIDLVVSMALLVGPPPYATPMFGPPTPELARREARLSPQLVSVDRMPEPPLFHFQPTPVGLESRRVGISTLTLGTGLP